MFVQSEGKQHKPERDLYMSKKLKFMVLDCETATLPFANEIANNDADRKKRIAIARPLIYDIGWVICDRQGNVYDKKQFLIAETFSVPAVFNTAYYAEKRPIYLEMLENKEINIEPWNRVAEYLVKDMENVDAIGAFNSMFDFKKAIPFTELYIKKLYSADYFQWEKIQYKLCENIANKNKNENDKKFDPNNFLFRGKNYPLFDIWGLATTYLLNNATYKKECLKHDLFTASGTYFKTSAESTYKYLKDKYDFIEAHTALNDAEIETFILSKIAMRHRVEIGIKYFPFRDLGYTYEFCMRTKTPIMEDCQKIYNAISEYIENKEETPYINGLIKRLEELAEYMGINPAL